MLNIGPLELMMIAVVALVVVGPRRLPEIGRQAGKLIRDLRRMQDEVKDTIRFDLDDEPEDDDDEPPTARVRSSAREHRAHTSRVAREADGPDAGDEPAPQRTRPMSASDAARAQARAKERQAAAGQDGDERVPAVDDIEDRDRGVDDRGGEGDPPEEPAHERDARNDEEPREEPRAAEGS